MSFPLEEGFKKEKIWLRHLSKWWLTFMLVDIVMMFLTFFSTAEKRFVEPAGIG